MSTSYIIVCHEQKKKNLTLNTEWKIIFNSIAGFDFNISFEMCAYLL